METSREINWDELKGPYYHHVETLKNSMETAHVSAIELYRIFSQVMRKSNDTSPEMMKKFTDLWLKKLDLGKIREFDKINKKFLYLLNKEKPTSEDLNNFEQNLQRELKDRSLILLSAYLVAMRGFYDAWLEIWGK